MGRTALITGASGGIGKEFAFIHATAGDDVVLVARSRPALEETARFIELEYSVRAYVIEKDLSVSGAVAEIFDDISKQGIIVDYLINNAGFGDIGLFAESDWDKQERMINVNITALIHLTRLVLPGMIERRSGRVLNIASTAAFQPGPTMSVYFASKAFVLSFSEAIGNEVRKSGVTVTALCPGSTESGFHSVALGVGKKVKERKIPSAASVAMYGYKAMMKGAPVAIPGFKNVIMAFCIRFMPRQLVVRAARMIQESKQ
jgi:uncharacterized protein